MSEPSDLALLDPAARLSLADDGLALTRGAATTRGLSAREMFPWTARGTHVALLDGDGRTVAVIADLAALDEPSRDAVRRSLGERRFLPEILALVDLEFRRNVYHWTVDTDRGRRTFRTRHGWAQEPVVRQPTGELLITATDGVRYRIGRPESLGPQALLLLETLL